MPEVSLKNRYPAGFTSLLPPQHVGVLQRPANEPSSYSGVLKQRELKHAGYQLLLAAFGKPASRFTAATAGGGLCVPV